MKIFLVNDLSSHRLTRILRCTISMILTGFIVSGMCFAQTPGEADELPYNKIPDYPDKYTAGTVAARLVDGLGFRFYWATEGLRAEDLSFKPSEEARTSLETITHIYGLSLVIVNSTIKTPNKPVDGTELGFPELRKQTLLNIKKAADILRTCSDEEFTDFKLIFQNDQGTTEFPFWNNLNGPIADALWHCGQIVSLRRSSGNPFNSNVSVFNGRVRN
jgi:hypothetical protein